MELSINKCIGCIYYTKINTYTTSTSTNPDDLVNTDRDEYYSCSKPYLVRCPRESGCITEELSTQIIVNRCIICGEYTSNEDEMICDECKEAIKKLKERLKDERL